MDNESYVGVRRARRVPSQAVASRAVARAGGPFCVCVPRPAPLNRLFLVLDKRERRGLRRCTLQVDALGNEALAFTSSERPLQEVATNGGKQASDQHLAGEIKKLGGGIPSRRHHGSLVGGRRQAIRDPHSGLSGVRVFCLGRLVDKVGKVVIIALE